MLVEEFMTRNPVACDVNDAVADVAKLMRDKNLGFVIALRHGKVAGVVTDRDLVVGVMAEGLDPKEVPVKDAMTEHPATVTTQDNLFSVLDTLRSAGVVRRVPVVNDRVRNELVGVVSISDLSVIARDLVDAVLLEDTRHALKEVRLPTGGKAVRKEIRSPTHASEHPRRARAR